MAFQSNDIFTFDPAWIYKFTLMGGLQITGTIIRPFDNGIVLNDGTHIPTDKIVCFVPISIIKENETPE
ncbi:putative membrane protein [Erwinia phage pEa_SNUABM_50]|uniref:Uncharacterized protein n=4 Tax=Eneladusvirus BF TaxID=2560751 RepID=A0A1S6UAR8_9CAUD|nr:membrane protein [Serratia phage BF]QOI71240.1 putative membrane protein [Erwinia phage pEa_SNUABM_12]QOI71784.1 putative membrane protein [Erwinia phage pEa_SNUABM_47]QOI72323.1 putative membrane protein [Erwinia phage pEa_SNUABM_50]QXO11449.1 hypothetical protein pEaSNUABM19_00303 [Erwinia phage pEa_SNUABM_19]QXO11997.1 hypothetical protein pEaSNUABM44_00301 [Erwinia phage pEa_SNUABM_44]